MSVTSYAASADARRVPCPECGAPRDEKCWAEVRSFPRRVAASLTTTPTTPPAGETR